MRVAADLAAAAADEEVQVATGVGLLDVLVFHADAIKAQISGNRLSTAL